MKIGTERYQDCCAICSEGSLSAFRARFFSIKGRWKTNDPDVIIGRDCRHIFHETCARQWVEAHNTCPTCRTPFKRRDVQQELARDVGIRIQQNTEIVPLEVLDRLSLPDIENHMDALKNELTNQDGTLSPEEVERKKIQHSLLRLAYFNTLLNP